MSRLWTTVITAATGTPKGRQHRGEGRRIRWWRTACGRRGRSRLWQHLQQLLLKTTTYWQIVVILKDTDVKMSTNWFYRVIRNDPPSSLTDHWDHWQISPLQIPPKLNAQCEIPPDRPTYQSKHCLDASVWFPPVVTDQGSQQEKVASYMCFPTTFNS